MESESERENERETERENEIQRDRYRLYSLKYRHTETQGYIGRAQR